MYGRKQERIKALNEIERTKRETEGMIRLKEQDYIKICLDQIYSIYKDNYFNIKKRKTMQQRLEGIIEFFEEKSQS